jgi:hypothetical protein
MKPAGVLATAALTLGAGAILFVTFRSRGEGAEARLARAQLKREFLERGAPSRQLPADRARDWRDDCRAHLKWYFDELAAIEARHPRERKKPPEPAGKGKGRDKEGQAAQAEWQRYAEERMALMRDGKYEPVLSGGENGLRLDLLALEPAPNPASGEKGIRVEFALWGVPRRVDRETQAGTSRTVTRVTVPVTFRELSVRFFDAKGKPYGEMSGPGEPYQKLADPERFVEDFPPGILFGTWYLDLLPREAARAEMTLSVEARGAGAGVVAAYRFELPLREEWKLPVGEPFKAQVREAAP